MPAAGKCPKPAQLKAFWKIDFRLAKKISSSLVMTTSIPLPILLARDVAFCPDNHLLQYYNIVARKIQVFYRTFFGEVCITGQTGREGDILRANTHVRGTGVGVLSAEK